jgi:hypothetical protein
MDGESVTVGIHEGEHPAERSIHRRRDNRNIRSRELIV